MTLSVVVPTVVRRSLGMGGGNLFLTAEAIYSRLPPIVKREFDATNPLGNVSSVGAFLSIKTHGGKYRVVYQISPTSVGRATEVVVHSRAIGCALVAKATYNSSASRCVARCCLKDITKHQYDQIESIGDEFEEGFKLTRPQKFTVTNGATKILMIASEQSDLRFEQILSEHRRKSEEARKESNRRFKRSRKASERRHVEIREESDRKFAEFKQSCAELQQRQDKQIEDQIKRVFRKFIWVGLTSATAVIPVIAAAIAIFQYVKPFLPWVS